MGVNDIAGRGLDTFSVWVPWDQWKKQRAAKKGGVAKPVQTSAPTPPPPPAPASPSDEADPFAPDGGDPDEPLDEPPGPVERIRPRIQANQRLLDAVVADSWRAIRMANVPPVFFRRVNRPVRIVAGDDAPEIEAMDETQVFGHLGRVATWFRVGKEGDETDSLPLREAARDVLHNVEPETPQLESVVSTPIFDGASALVSTPGYHPSSRLWLHRTPALGTLDIPDVPTRDEVDAARDLILGDLLIDFRFVEDADTAHAIAALVLPFIRRMVRGFTPLHLIEAPTPGSGKGLLSDLIAIVATGRVAEPTTISGNEDDTRKKLVSILLKAPPIVVLDNLRFGIDSSEVASVLTADPFTDRILGKSEMVRLPNKIVWLATGNNPKLSMEIARRCLRIRIDPQSEQPWKRTGFKHKEIRTWAKTNRRELVRAVLLIVQSWIAAGKPPGETGLGSFEEWARIVGGILAHINVPSFLANADALYDAADAVSAEWREFVTAWWTKHDKKEVTASDLRELAAQGMLLPSVVRDEQPRAQLKRIGDALKSKRDSRIGRWKIHWEPDSHAKAAHYLLEEIEPAGPVEPPLGQGRFGRDW